MKSPITQVEIAQASGLSRSTVSYAFNERLRSRLRPETQQQVLATAQRLGYAPNRAARGLRTGRFHAVGLVIPDVTNMFFSVAVGSFERLLETRGYDLLVEDTHLSVEREKHCLRKMVERQVDGFVCHLMEPVLHAEFFARQWEARRPVVAFAPVATKEHELLADTIELDFSAGISSAVEHLTGLGHRRIAFVCGLGGGQADEGRVSFFQTSLEQQGLRLPPNHVIRCGHTLQDGRDAFGGFLQQTPMADRPTAVIALNDVMAIGLMRAALDQGLRIPEDLSVIGVDDTPLDDYLPVRLTSVSQPYNDMAEQAVDFLLERVDGRKWPEPRRQVFKTSLVVRGSTAQAKS